MLVAWDYVSNYYWPIIKNGQKLPPPIASHSPKLGYAKQWDMVCTRGTSGAIGTGGGTAP